jgi:hypothetical protein
MPMYCAVHGVALMLICHLPEFRAQMDQLMKMVNHFRSVPDSDRIKINALVDPALESIPHWLAPVVARAELVGPSEFPSVSPKVTASSASPVLSACLSGKGNTAHCMAQCKTQCFCVHSLVFSSASIASLYCPVPTTCQELDPGNTL